MRARCQWRSLARVAKRLKEARGMLDEVGGARSADFDGRRGLLRVTASTVSSTAPPLHCIALIRIGLEFVLFLF